MKSKLPEPLDGDAIAELARAIVAGTFISANQIPEDLLTLAFMPLALGAFKDWTEEELSAVMVYAIRGKHTTTGQAVNGWPIFVEISFCRYDDYVTALNRARLAREALYPPAAEAGPT